MLLTLHTFMTLDGVMQGPGGKDEDTSGGFSAGGWTVPYTDEGFGEIVDSWFAKTSAVLLGRTTFEMFREFWPHVDDTDPVARVLNHSPKYVVAHDGFEPGWESSHLISGSDPLPAIRALKESGTGELQVHGSWQLARSLHNAGLIDEYRLVIFPVTVGAGKRLFAEDGPPRSFRPITTRTTAAGGLYIEATPGELRQGTYIVEDGRERPVLED
ncbi:dihydrofolate reductase family protein [Brevibacterium daeguense]|uniref:Dihydrofolate reductase family protein n=1 Tax=Brevibacterium daeguense TaxID=909936 RepID=A0ABP8EJP5_9MICO|nr:dihydrofolate reductase family protein [Brevibacterium daeguense]